MKHLFLAIAMLCMVACNGVTEATGIHTKQQSSRFEVEYRDYAGSAPVQIIVDKKTGVKYLLVKAGYGAGLTKLEE